MQLKKFIHDHEDLIKLARDDPSREVLLWAHHKKLIVLKSFGRNFYYTKQDEQDAKMWREKLNETGD